LAGGHLGLRQDAGRAELLLQLVDPVLDLLLLFLGGVVLGVLFEVALLGRFLDLAGQVAALFLELLQVAAELLVPLTGQKRFAGQHTLLACTIDIDRRKKGKSEGPDYISFFTRPRSAPPSAAQASAPRRIPARVHGGR